jgi:hypothetical protein
MSTIYIKFATHEERVRGFFELATRSRVKSLPGEVYEVPDEAEKLLQDQQIGFRRATDEEVKLAQQQVRTPDPAIVIDAAPVRKERFLR